MELFAIAVLVGIVLLGVRAFKARNEHRAPDGPAAFTCEGCGAKLRAPLGASTRCPRCKAVQKAPNKASSTRATGTSKSPSVKVDLQCPMCGDRSVETAERLSLVRGFVLFSRHGSYSVVGCRPCVSREARSEALRTMLFGLWCVPWGIAAPFVAVANLHKSFREPVRSELESALALAGLNLADLEVGSDGLSKAERDRLAAVAKILGTVAMRAGTESLEWATAVEVLVAMSSRRLNADQMDQWMKVLADEQTHSGASARERLIHDFEDRLMVLRIAVEVALADGQLSPEEFLALSEVASALNLSDHDLAAILAVLTDSNADSQSTSGLRPEVANAFRVLGLEPDASTAEIRDAHKSLMLQHHPDLAPEDKKQEATTRSAEINNARDVLLGVRS